MGSGVVVVKGREGCGSDGSTCGDGGRSGLSPYVSGAAALCADGYYEWYPTQRTTKAGEPIKQPFFIRPEDGGVLAMAGLYGCARPTKLDEP